MSSKHSRDDDVDDQVEKKRRRVVTPAKSSEKMMASDKVDTKMVFFKFNFIAESYCMMLLMCWLFI